jgi:hypothetical protein
MKNGKGTVGSAVAELHGQIENLRERRQRLLDQHYQVQGQPITEDELSSRVEAVIRALQARAAPLVTTDLVHAESEVRGLVGDMVAKPLPALALAAVLDPDKLRVFLMSQARNELKTLGPSLPVALRAKQLKQIEDDVLQIERTEAGLLWEAEAAGITPPWRADLDARAILGLP